LLALASLACAQEPYVETVDTYSGASGATGYATIDIGYGAPSTGEYTDTGTDYVTTGDEAYPPPSPEVPFTPPEVIYTAGYGTDYYADDPLALLWQAFWNKYHIMKHQVDVIEAYRDEITMQVNKLSQKVFAWCRSKSKISLNCMMR